MTVPKLRFKEFDGDWNSIAIGSLLKIKSGLGFKAEEYTTEEAIRLLQIENVGYGTVKWTHNVKYVPHDYLSIHPELVLKENDIVLALNRPVTNDQLKIAKLTNEDSPSILYQRVGKLEFKENEIDHNFIFQIFQKEVKSYVLNSSIGSDQPFISTTDLYKHKIILPYQKEQTKIASFLSAVDEKISQLTQKHALLSQYKQGMMQKLFSQQIRFKADDGSEFGEWEEVRLGNLVDLTSGFAFKSDFFSEDGNKLITPKNFTTTGKANFTDTNTKWTTEISDKKYICRPNDLLVLLTDLTQSCELLGKPILLSQDDGNVLLNQRIVKIIPNRKLEKPFLLYLLLTDDFHELIVSTASGTTVKHSSNKVLQNFHFYLPCLEEQTKIANFLSAIDQKIEGVAQQIEQAKTWKKGLLQQMFV